MKKEQYYNKTLKELYGYFQKIEYKLEKLGKKEFLFMIPLVCFAPIPISASSMLMYCMYMLKILYSAGDYQTKYFDFYLNSVEYQDVYKVYKIVLEELSLLFEKMNWDSEMKIYAGYYYLLRNGYLSVDKSFYYRRDIDHAMLLKGANIMQGYGNCGNISGMLTDLLKYNNYEAYNISMLLPNDAKFSVFNYDFIEEQLLKESYKLIELGEKKEFLYLVFEFLFKIFGSKKTNHLVTLFKNDIHSYAMDPTNNTIFFVNDKARCLFSNGDNYYIKCDRFDNMNQKNKLSNLLKTTSCGLMDDLCKDYYDVYNNCDDCVDVFEKFYQEHKCLYEDVVDKKKILVREYSKYKPF